MRRIAATLAAGATSLALLALNLIPRRGVISTPEDGVWPGSWSAAYGWPSTAYYAFGYDARTRMYSWTPEALASNALAASVTVAVAILLALVLAPRPR